MIIQKYEKNILIIVLSIFLLFLTMKIPASPISIGIDPSYMFAFNYFFQHHIPIGENILFTFGPLGFLLFPMPLGDNILIATIIHSIIKFLFIFGSLFLYHQNKKILNFFHYFIVLIALYIIASSISLPYLLIFTPLIFLLNYHTNKNILFGIFSSILIALALLTKSSLGIIGISILFSFSIYTWIKKDFKTAAILIFFTIFSFLTIWFLLYNNIIYIPQYLYAIIEFSQGNSSAMTQNPNNNWWIFTLFIIFFITYPFLSKYKLIQILFGITFLATIAMFKYAISREDHIFEFELFLYHFIFIIFLIEKNITLKNILHLLMIYLTFIAFIYFTPSRDKIPTHIIQKHFSSIKFNNFNILDVHTSNEKLRQKSEKLIKSRKLDTKTTTTIGNSSIESYPVSTTIFAANKFNWRPRPIFQSYITYTSYLDNINAHFFNSKSAPEYLIWSGAPTLSNHYLLNDNPATIYQILNHYYVINKYNTYSLMQHTEKNLLSSTHISKKTYTWNQWITIPNFIHYDEYTYMIAKINLKRSLLQKLKKLIYKEFEVFIDYKLINDKIIRYRLIVDTTQNGIWITPLLDKLFEYPISNKVEAIRITHHGHDYFTKDFSIEWEQVKSTNKLFKIKQSERVQVTLKPQKKNIHFSFDSYIDSNKTLTIKGWAFENNATIDLSKKFIILKDKSNNVLAFKTYEIIRKDVTKYFQAKNLHHSGFHAEINKQNIPNGIYDLYLLLIDPNEEQNLMFSKKKVKVSYP